MTMATAKNHSTILVTGGAGYIGSHVVLALRDAEWPVVVVDDLSTGRRDLVAPDIPFVEGDVADIALMRQTLCEHGCAGVMHFAGSIVVPESVTDPLTYYRNNTSASRDLIEAAVAENINAFVFSSSAAVYGTPDTVPTPEDAPLHPINPYGTAKLMTEWMLRDVAQVSDLRYAALRYFNVAGADPQGRSGQCAAKATHLIKIACEAASGKRQRMEIHGDDYDTADGTCVRDYIHVSDLAAAHVVALDHLLGGDDNLTLNCGYGHGFTVRQVLDVLQDLVDKPLPISVGPRRPGDAPALVADSRRIRETLGWTPRFDDLRVIVESALAWERHLQARPAA